MKKKNELIHAILFDYKFVFHNLIKNNVFYFISFLFVLPFFSLIFALFTFFTLLYSIIYNLLFLYKKFLFFLKKKEIKALRYKFNDNIYKNSFILSILVFLNISKKKGYQIMYNIQKFHHKKFIFDKNIYILMIFNFILRVIFITIFYFNIKIFKLSIHFLNLIKKYKNKKINIKQRVELIFINLSQIYDSELTDFVKNNKIIFDIKNNQIIFNPGNQVKILKSLLNDKFRLNEENLMLIFEYINTIKEESSLEYNILCEEVEKNYPNSFKGLDGKYYIGEKIPHISLVIPYEKEKEILIRETKSEPVNIKNINKDSNINLVMQTSFKSKGSIDKDLEVFKTPIISADIKDIYNINNKKLINNILNGLANKNDFVGNFLNSMYKPTYIFEKGNIFKDPKYLNFHEKVICKFNHSENKTEQEMFIKKLMDVWDEHFFLFKNLQNSEVVENIIKFLITQSDFVISPDIIQDILNL